ncbi:hypothetical protein F4823DRAFT_614495 [Ustulina deusta]|nr:hypothetical protein F4823DRAFT_614495 [Ustulina deusta]
MDDPWGSPWASTDAPSDNDPPASSRADIVLSPPPKAFFGNGTSVATQSAWSSNHDDGGLGIWTTADNQNEWGTWAESVVQPPRLSPRLNGSGKESPLAWPENAAASPVFMANSRSRTPSIFRHHSPDPWATELSLTNRSDVELQTSTKSTTSDTLAIGIWQSGEVSRTVTGSGGEGNTNSENAPVEEGFTVGRNDCPRSSHDLAGEHANTSSQLDSAVYELPSRPSSTCSVDSHDEPERQDSPITSIDEDRGARIGNNLGNNSGKVQELVGIYDGLSRATSEEPPALSRPGMPLTSSRGESLVRSKTEDDDNDDDGGVGFGNFEDALADGGRVARSPGEYSPSESSSTPKAELKDVFTHKPEYEGEEGRVIITETTPIRSPKPPNRFQDIMFDTNISLVEKLFPSLPDPLTSCFTGDWEVPDHVLGDSFTTISERQAWYRISRFGSIRKHNSGDDENYHRVTWPASQLHSDTIKIVRRWMEEDAYAGRATLGGTKRTGFFDWDSNAAPVELDQVFRRRKSVTKHTRTTSIPANNIVVQTRSADARPYRNSTGISLPAGLQSASQPIMAVPSFGWISETKEIPPSTHFSPISSPTPNSVSVPAPVQTTFMDEDDDDWGEMVSSPRATKDPIELIVPTFPLPETLIKEHDPKPQLSLTISDVDQSAGPTLPAPRDTPPIGSDPWSLPDISVLDKPKQVPQSLPGHAYQTGALCAISKANTPLPNHGSFESLKAESTIKYETPSENMITGLIAVNKPSKEMAATSSPLQGNESQDDAVVQQILHHLPDLSYMLR